MSVPSEVFDFLTSAVSTTDAVDSVFPFVRPAGDPFPFVVYDFQGDEYKGSTWTAPGKPLVRFSGSVFSRSIEEAETVAQAIVAAAPGNGCPFRVIMLTREYEPSYDGQRPGEYITTVQLETL